MKFPRMDHIVLVVEDLAPAVEFFRELGLAVEGEMPVEGAWVDRVNGMKDVRVDIVMMVTPDGHGKLELTRFRSPALLRAEPNVAPPNVLGFRSVMFEVENVDDTVTRLRKHGGELVGQIENYENFYRLCYVRGPAASIIALAQKIG